MLASSSRAEWTKRQSRTDSGVAYLDAFELRRLLKLDWYLVLRAVVEMIGRSLPLVFCAVIIWRLIEYIVGGAVASAVTTPTQPQISIAHLILVLKAIWNITTRICCSIILRHPAKESKLQSYCTVQ